MYRKLFECIDAGGENCPCYLAATGDCITCSRLSGKEYCDCVWRGVCIYNEFVLNNKKVNNPRKEFSAQIERKKIYRDDLTVYVLNVGKGMALKSCRPGSYIFARSSKTEKFYDVPISIMYSDIEKGQIHIAIKVISAKTKKLTEEKDFFEIRGPYRNGLHGLKSIEKAFDGKTLIIARGVGIAPAIQLINEIYKKSKIELIVDTTKTNRELIRDYLDNFDIQIRYMNLEDHDDEITIAELIRKEEYSLISVFASDYFTMLFGNIARENKPKAGLLLSNNFNICCGEGICGACSVVNDKGETIKMCKCQMNGEEVLRRRTVYE